MITDPNIIIKIFNEEKPVLLSLVKRRMREPMFSIIDCENCIDEVLISVINGPRIKVGFKTRIDIRKYLRGSVNIRGRNQYFKKRGEKTPISTTMLMRNLELARSIVNSHRK